MGFKQQIAIRRKKSFSQKMNEDMYNSIKSIKFDLPVLGIFLSHKFNDDVPFTEKMAEELDANNPEEDQTFIFSKQLIFEFEKTCNITEPFTFNELQYFKNVAFAEENSLSAPEKFVKEITLPETYNSVPPNTFYLWKGLEEVHFKNKIMEEFSERCFEECINLKHIEFSYGVRHIGFAAFYYCSSLKSIELPDSLVDLGGHAFSHCENLESIKLSNQLEDIPEECFSFCKNLKEITIPESIKTLSVESFSECRSLKEIFIPKNVIWIQNSCFAHCTKLETAIFSNECNFKHFVGISNKMFIQCRNLKNVKLADSIESIGDSAFRSCSKLEEIKLPENLAVIGISAFSKCVKLKEIDIPEKTKIIYNSAFYDCPSLKKVTIHHKFKYHVIQDMFLPQKDDNDDQLLRFNYMKQNIELCVPERYKEYYVKMLGNVFTIMVN